mmetsp:Transcript_67783/g.214457  ORF Transcript_67783/g.214457 Transcript_67783/m.214457 type:complete len:87 (-) Transcript_67783:245-505(-)
MPASLWRESKWFESSTPKAISAARRFCRSPESINLSRMNLLTTVLDTCSTYARPRRTLNKRGMYVGHVLASQTVIESNIDGCFWPI